MLPSTDHLKLVPTYGEVSKYWHPSYYVITSSLVPPAFSNTASRSNCNPSLCQLQIIFTSQYLDITTSTSLTLGRACCNLSSSILTASTTALEPPANRNQPVSKRPVRLRLCGSSHDKPTATRTKTTFVTSTRLPTNTITSSETLPLVTVWWQDLLVSQSGRNMMLK